MPYTIKQTDFNTHSLSIPDHSRVAMPHRQRKGHPAENSENASEQAGLPEADRQGTVNKRKPVGLKFSRMSSSLTHHNQVVLMTMG